MPPTHGRMLSRYRLDEKIGEGGFGGVWHVQDTRLGNREA